jgi:mannan endo-1,6-alpha-mannosidase
MWKQAATQFCPIKDPQTDSWLPEYIMIEASCLKKNLNHCSIDQGSFKAWFVHWLATTAHLAPFLKDKIMPKFRASARGAAKACTDGKAGLKCGRNRALNA